MTKCGHDHRAVAELKARLSEHLRSVRKGRTLTVLDRDTPVARIVPYAGEPMPTPLGTLDAIHLATALIWRERLATLATIATHDSPSRPPPGPSV